MVQGNDPQETLQLREFYISPSDQIKITVFNHDELSREVKIPPDGRFTYPIVGEIDTTGMSLRILRDTLEKGLSAPREQVLQPGDNVTISVYRNKDLDRSTFIPPDGTILFPPGGRIRLEGKTPKEAGDDIARELSKYIVDPKVVVSGSSILRIVNPQITIEVREFGGHKIYVLGEVKTPGVYNTDGNTSLVEALSKAGGTNMDGKVETVLVIRNTRKPKPDLLVFNVRDFYKSGNFAQNPYLQRGDIVYVPRTFISNVDRFFDHLSKIVSPIVGIGSGFTLYKSILQGTSSQGQGVSISVPSP